VISGGGGPIWYFGGPLGAHGDPFDVFRWLDLMYSEHVTVTVRPL